MPWQTRLAVNSIFLFQNNKLDPALTTTASTPLQLHRSGSTHSIKTHHHHQLSRKDLAVLFNIRQLRTANF
jgi:hypothetical protein